MPGCVRSGYHQKNMKVKRKIEYLRRIRKQQLNYLVNKNAKKNNCMDTSSNRGNYTLEDLNIAKKENLEIN